MSIYFSLLFLIVLFVCVVYGHDHIHDEDDHGRSCGGHSKSFELFGNDSEYHSKYKMEVSRGDKMVHKMKRYRDHTYRKSVNGVDLTDDLTDDEKLEKRRLLSEADEVIKIPIVWHVLYTNDDENLSEDQLESQISVLNKDFRGTNSEITSGEIDSTFEDRVGDSKLEFYTKHIERVSVASGVCDDESQMKQSGSGGSDGWDAGTYLNIWTCEISYLGYAYYPCLLGGSSEYKDGVVLHNGAIGSTNDDSSNNFYFAYSSYNEGRTATHEIGHYLNLMHIWGDSSGCSSDDGVDDTPTSSTSNYGCPDTSTNSCDATDSETGTDLRDNYENYMDYSDDACMFMFTEEQVIRMRSVVSSTGCRSEMFVNGGGTGTDSSSDSSDIDTSTDTNDGELYCDNGCSLPEEYVNDGYCDCSDCEDEEDWTCSSCNTGGDSCDDVGNDCSGYSYCYGSTDTSTSDDDSDSTDDSNSDDDYFECNDGCQISSFWRNDGYWCDCSECEDESSLTCGTCANDAGYDCDYIGEECGNFISCSTGYKTAASSREEQSESNSGSNNDNTSTIIIIIAVVACVLLVVIIGAYFIRKKCIADKENGHLLNQQVEYAPPPTVVTN